MSRHKHRIFQAGSHLDQMTLGAACEMAARELAAACKDAKKGRLDLYREVLLPDQRTCYVRVSWTVVFIGYPGDGTRNMPLPKLRIAED